MAVKVISPDERRYRDELGGRSCVARRAGDLTRVELARRSGIHRNVLALYESAQVMPSPFSLLRLARGLGVSRSWLLGRLESTAVNGMTCSTKVTMGPEMIDPEFRNRGTAVGEAANGDGKTGRA